jgi:hypothetical protein
MNERVGETTGERGARRFRGSMREVTSAGIRRNPSPALLHPMEEREESRSLMQPRLEFRNWSRLFVACHDPETVRAYRRIQE